MSATRPVTDAGQPPPAAIRSRSDTTFDALFHLALVVIGALNVVALARQTGDHGPLAEQGSWWVSLGVALWLVPSVFYLRTWAGAAKSSRLWMRAPLVQLVGILVAATGAVAALLRVLTAALGRVAAAGVAVTVDPEPGRATVGEVSSQLLWEALDAVPLLHLTGSLGWEPSVLDPDWPLGVAGVLARVAVAVLVVWTFLFLVRRMRVTLLPRPDLPTEGQPTESAGTSERPDSTASSTAVATT